MRRIVTDKDLEPKILTQKPIRQFPHCDPRVLHAPGECKYCDKHPDWQQLRITWGICFTGYEPSQKKELPCPAWFARGDNCQKWSGNIARRPIVREDDDDWDDDEDDLD